MYMWIIWIKELPYTHFFHMGITFSFKTNLSYPHNHRTYYYYYYILLIINIYIKTFTRRNKIMKFVINRDRLMANIQDVMKAISASVDIPILERMNVEVKKNGNTLYGSD